MIKAMPKASCVKVLTTAHFIDSVKHKAFEEMEPIHHGHYNPENKTVQRKNTGL